MGLLALAARLAYRFLADEPLLFSHQYHYWEGALRIVEHERPLAFILRSDEWREWPLGGPWTIAPLYYLFVAGLLALSGKSLVFVQVVQCVLDAAVAVTVGHLGARAAGSARGRWAGAAYALYWPSIQLCNSTMTEALHTPLLALAFVLLGRVVPETDGGGPPSVRGALGAGLAFGFGGLARTVGLAFVPLAAAFVFFRRRRSWPAALALLAGAALPIVPWAVRNRVVMGDPALIESASVANLLVDNVYLDGERYDRLEHFVFKERTPEARRERALEFVRQGVRKRAHLIPAKLRHNATHFLRPEGLWVLLGVQHAWPAWRHVLNVVFDDGWLVLTVPLFAAWLAAGRGPLRGMVLAWTALYLFFIIVVFHSEIRYRMPLVPYAMAGAAGGVAVLAGRGRRRTAWAAALAGAAAVLVVSIAPFAKPAWRGAVAFVRLQDAGAALSRGDLAAAQVAATRAAAADPTSMWPWIRFGRWVARAGRPVEALAAYERAAPLREVPWEPPAVRPALLARAGRLGESTAAADHANAVSLAVDSWIILDVAWRALPAPVADEVLLARGDYGAVRDFTIPRATFRWSRAGGRVRLRPATPASAYDVIVEMGAPPPAPAPEGGTAVDVTVEGARRERFRVGPAFAEYRVRTAAPADGVIDVELESRPWSHTGQPAAQGIAVRRVALVPVPAGAPR